MLSNIARASLVAHTVKNPPIIKETWVQSLGREDPLEKGIATHPYILVWKIPWTKESCRLQSRDGKELVMTEQLTLQITWKLLDMYFNGEGKIFKMVGLDKTS